MFNTPVNNFSMEELARLPGQLLAAAAVVIAIPFYFVGEGTLYVISLFRDQAIRGYDLGLFTTAGVGLLTVIFLYIMYGAIKHSNNVSPEDL